MMKKFDFSLVEIGNKFEEYMAVLEKIYDSKETADIKTVNFILERYPWLKPLVVKIGYKDSFILFEQEKYHLTNIKRKAINYQDTSINQIVADQLYTYREVSIGTFISAAKAKEIIKEIYSTMNIEKTPKGSDFKLYFICQDHTKRVKDKIIHGFIPIQNRYGCTKI
jgi:hypothetical protein